MNMLSISHLAKSLILENKIADEYFKGTLAQRHNITMMRRITPARLPSQWFTPKSQVIPYPS